MEQTDNYNDIIMLSHHVSANRPHMTIHDRAAQFSAFAALKGYDDEIDEAARHTDDRIVPCEERMEEINEKLLLICEQAANRPAVKIVYFVPDGKKDGGSYRSVEGIVCKFDVYNRLLLFDGGEKVSFADIYDIELK